jgi:hypothetical protein
MAYATDKVRIERKVVHTVAIPQRKMATVARRVSMREHDDEHQDMA